MLMTTSPNVMIYAALDGWRRQMVEHGHDLLGGALALADEIRAGLGALPGLRVLGKELLGAEASHELDPLHVVIDVSALGISGYDAADWLREHQRLDLGLSDHRRIEATLSVADDDQTAARLCSALRALTEHAVGLPPAKPVMMPSAAGLLLEPAMRPRDAFFAVKETVAADAAAGMQLPDPADPGLDTIRVVTEGASPP
jgi:arginine decarboxylase